MHIRSSLWYKEGMEYKVIRVDDDNSGLAVYNFRSVAHFLDWLRENENIEPRAWTSALSSFLYDGQIVDKFNVKWVPYEDTELDMRTCESATMGYEVGSLPVPTTDEIWEDVEEREDAFVRALLPKTMSTSNLTMSVGSLLNGSIKIRKSHLKSWRFDATTEVDGKELVVAHMGPIEDDWELTSEYIKLWKKKR